jgi:hypothetical protein
VKHNTAKKTKYTTILAVMWHTAPADAFQSESSLISAAWQLISETLVGMDSDSDSNAQESGHPRSAEVGGMDRLFGLSDQHGRASCIGVQN